MNSDSQKKYFKKCYVCDKKASKERNIRLHTFPKASCDVVRFERWLHVLGLSKTDEVRTLVVCSRHFVPNDYCNPGSKRFLTKSAVPSVGVPNQLPLPKAIGEPFVPPQINADINKESPEERNGDHFMMGTPGKDAETDMASSLAKSGTGPDHRMSPQKAHLPKKCMFFLRSPTAVKIANKKNFVTPPTSNPVAAIHLPRLRYVPKVFLSHVASPRRTNHVIQLIHKPDRTESLELERLRNENRQLRATNSSLHQAVSTFKSKLELISKGGTVQDVAAVANCDKYISLQALKKDLLMSNDQLPKDWVLSTALCEKVVLFYFGDRDTGVNSPDIVTRSISVKEDLTVEIRARGKLYTGDLGNVATISCKQDIFAAMKSIAELHLCSGLEDGTCRGAAFSKTKPRRGLCSVCSAVRRQTRRTAKRRLQRLHLKQALLKKDKYKLMRQVRGLQTKLDKTLENTRNVQTRCAKIEEALKKIPKTQQEAMRARLNASSPPQPG